MFSPLVLVVMAMTSHDFWLSFLTLRFLKAMHLLVHAAYASIVLHVALGSLAGGGNPAMMMVLAAGGNGTKASAAPLPDFTPAPARIWAAGG